MNIGKSIKKALIDTDKNGVWLATELKTSPTSVYNMCGKKTCSGNMLMRLGDVFNMKVSELIALGESE